MDTHQASSYAVCVGSHLRQTGTGRSKQRLWLRVWLLHRSAQVCRTCVRSLFFSTQSLSELSSPSLDVSKRVIGPNRPSLRAAVEFSSESSSPAANRRTIRLGLCMTSPMHLFRPRMQVLVVLSETVDPPTLSAEKVQTAPSAWGSKRQHGPWGQLHLVAVPLRFRAVRGHESALI